MRIPKEFTIKGKTWKVEYKWGLKSGNEMIDGLCDPNERTIFIRRELLKDEKPHIFLHEFFHAVFFEAHLSYNDGWVPDLVEEIICDALALSIKENFKLRPYRSQS